MIDGQKTEDSKDSYGCSDSQPLECLWKYVLLQHSNSSIGLVVLIYFTNGMRSCCCIIGLWHLHYHILFFSKLIKFCFYIKRALEFGQ